MTVDCSKLRCLERDAEVAPCDEKHFLLRGPVGLLEAILTCPDVLGDSSAVAVVCHPHPLHGGTMTNKVVHTVANTFVNMGVPTLRFNFRGVGCSQGAFDHGVGEVEDLRAVVDYLRDWYPDRSLWLAGFSFGAHVAFVGHHAVEAARLLLVAPPIRMFDFSGQADVGIPWLVVQGGLDDITDPEQVAVWVRNQSNPPEFQWLADAGHFFHGRLVQLREAIVSSWV